MAFQIIFVMEADEKSRSDYFYIRSVLDKWYDFRSRNDVKISEVFMGGKGNYNKKKVVNSIQSKAGYYRMTGETHVIYCFDTDKYDSIPAEKIMFQCEKEYCEEHGYEFVWFCQTIEDVFLGNIVSKSEKTDSAKRFKIRGGIKDVKIDNLTADTIARKKSNLITVLDKYLTRVSKR
jgi:hypothetical protein